MIIHVISIGGLMVCLPKDKADGFCQEIEVGRTTAKAIYWVYTPAGLPKEMQEIVFQWQ